MKYYKNTLILAFVSGALAVILGAFGAHALKEVLLSNGLTDSYLTGNRYHFYHTFALLVVAFLQMQGWQSKWLTWAAYSFLIGILLFSGSLYVMAVSNIRILGAITPFGGLAFIAAWLFLVIATLKNKK